MMAQRPITPWVRDEDLVETVYELRVVNSATRTKASSPRDAEIAELGSDGVALRVPKTLCAVGHLLSIELTFRRRPGILVISKLIMTGKVLTVAPLDEVSMLVSVRLYQYEEPLWAEFQEKHNLRQLRVSGAIRKRQE
jgi:hypothetical protein